MNKPIKCFIECLLPITACNIKCHYCYVAQRNNRKMKAAKLHYSPNIMAKALSEKRLGGAAYISICGAGETLMQKELPELVDALLKEGHYLNITTNGTVSTAFRKIGESIDPKMLKNINFSFSFHYLELKRKGFIQRFFDNIRYVKSLGCSFIVQVNLCDEYEDYFDEIKELCLAEIKSLPQLAVTRDEINLHKDIRLFTSKTKEEYIKMGSKYDSPLFEFTMRNFMVKRKEFCYAGEWTYVLDLSTGILKPCYASQIRQNIFSDIEKPIAMTAVGKHCKSPFCMNSSHFLSLGNIPTLDTPTYSELRNRKCTDGTEWYNDTMKEVLSKKFNENNTLIINKKIFRKQMIKDNILSLSKVLVPSFAKEMLKKKISK